jgi:hypothetical protein
LECSPTPASIVRRCSNELSKSIAAFPRSNPPRAASQVEILTKKYHIYLVSNGRISMAGINSGNVNYVADAIKDAVLSTAK